MTLETALLEYCSSFYYVDLEYEEREAVNSESGFLDISIPLLMKCLTALEAQIRFVHTEMSDFRLSHFSAIQVSFRALETDTEHTARLQLEEEAIASEKADLERLLRKYPSTASTILSKHKG